MKTTAGVFMFIEGAVLVITERVWASGSMETIFQGSNTVTNSYYRKDHWKQRKEKTEHQNITGKAVVLVGLPVMIGSIISLLA